jgi:hypothetical protein
VIVRCNDGLAGASCQVGQYVSREDQLASVSSLCKEVIDLLVGLKSVDGQPPRSESLESRRIEAMEVIVRLQRRVDGGVHGVRTSLLLCDDLEHVAFGIKTIASAPSSWFEHDGAVRDQVGSSRCDVWGFEHQLDRSVLARVWW